MEIPPPLRAVSSGTWRAALLGGVALVVLAGTPPAGDEPRAETRAGSRQRPAPPPVSAPGSASPSQSASVDARTASPRPADPVADQTAVLPPTHTVEPGETLGGVAERYRVTSVSMARANAVDPHGTLRPGQELVIPGQGPVESATPEEAVGAGLAVQRLLTDAAVESGLDPALVHAVAWVESRWQQRVVSGQGAIGLLQVRPATGQAMARLLDREIDLHRPEDNAVAGAAYLALRLERHHGDLRAALADYHQGPQSVAQQGRLPATARYIGDVLVLRERFAAQTAAR